MTKADELSNFRVVLSGNILPEYDRGKVLEDLAGIFNSSPDRMEKLLQGQKVSLKKQYDKDQARVICQKIREAGAQCEIEEISELQASVADDDNIELPSMATKTAAVKAVIRDVDQDIPPDDQSNNRHSDIGKLNRLIMAYVKTNTDYYQHQFAKFGDPENPEFKLSWHWPAFFFFFFWAMYRKLWGYAILYSVGAAFFTIFLKPGLLPIIWLLAWPLCINYLYYRKSIKVAKQALLQPEITSKILDRGGVSVAGVWISTIVVVVFTLIVGNYVTDQFMEEYGEEIKDVLPGSGTQMRGDGSAFDNSDPSQKALSETSLVLSSVGTLLKIQLVADANNDLNSMEQKSVAKYFKHFNNAEVKDGWGSKITVKKESNRYVFVSAGPDQVFETDDDILQPVSY